jgi:hypothetical protein
MPHKLYVYLKGGRGDAYVTDNWDGVAPEDADIVEEAEKSQPYRDIFTSSTPVTIKQNVAEGDGTLVPSKTFETPGNAVHFPAVAIEGWATGFDAPFVDAGLIGSTPTATTSDELAHEPPRQADLTYTWLIFREAGADGASFKFRKDLVIGYGKNPRA